MTPDSKTEDRSVAENQPELPSADDRRVQARRRFLSMSVGGSAALVVTVAHKRAFAGIKKNTVASACVSAQGVPDLKNADKKKALETSAMGTPKGLICRPRVNDTNKISSCPSVGTKTSKYYKTNNFNSQQLYISSKDFKDGCGDLDKTARTSYNYRLYEKGYCPITFDNVNGLQYQTTATYWKEDKGVLVQQACKFN